MFKCRDIHDHASEYLEGRLSSWERLKFRWHLFICVNCRNFIRQLKATIQAVAKIKPKTDAADVNKQVALLLQKHRTPSKHDH